LFSEVLKNLKELLNALYVCPLARKGHGNTVILTFSSPKHLKITDIKTLSFAGAYVTFTGVVENETQNEPGIDTSSPASTSGINQPTEGDYVELSVLEQACNSRQGSNKSSSSAASVHSSRSELRTLEFDYITGPNPKLNDKYSQLQKLNSEPRQWSETYDIIVR